MGDWYTDVVEVVEEVYEVTGNPQGREYGICIWGVAPGHLTALDNPTAQLHMSQCITRL
jgi:hypothetical protein